MRVFVDTNAFYSDLMIRGPLRVLFDAARRGDFVLVVPEVVVQEVLKQFRVRYETELRRYQTAAKALAELTLGTFPSPADPMNVDDACVIYEGELRERLHAASQRSPSSTAS